MKRPIWILFGIVIGMSLYPIVVEAVEYYGKFPPTAAWSGITLNDNDTTFDATLDAIQYNRELYIISDGSIIIEGLNSSGVLP